LLLLLGTMPCAGTRRTIVTIGVLLVPAFLPRDILTLITLRLSMLSHGAPLA
jgi:hypothetical protein